MTKEKSPSLMANRVFDLTLSVGGILLFRLTPWLNQTNAVWQYFWFVGGYIVFTFDKNYKHDISSERDNSIETNLRKITLLKNAKNKELMILATTIVTILITYVLYKYDIVNEYIACAISVIAIIVNFA